jgi:hypothetical protein
LVRQIGLDSLQAVGLDLNDWKYAELLSAASHGTHVAGIVLAASGNQARVHAATIDSFQTPTRKVRSDRKNLIRLAQRSATFGDFVESALGLMREESIQTAKRASAYLKQSGAGLANMSWGRAVGSEKEFADVLAVTYRKYGKAPETIKTLAPTGDLDLLQRLDIEVRVADAARFALAFHENPDVLFVIAAGNEELNNDDELPVPPYLARFFPNVLAVASCDRAHALSGFSNYGPQSVSLAAPGEKIESTILAHLTAPKSGTSMAAPHVTGVAARIRAEHANLSAHDVKEILEATVTKSASLKDLLDTGGVVNAEAARRAAADWPARRMESLVRSSEGHSPSMHSSDGPLVFDARQLETAAGDRGGWRITCAGGFTHTWRVVMSKPTRLGDQMHNGCGELDHDAVVSRWKEGWQITSLAGDEGGWNAVMSRGSKGKQRVFGLDKGDIAAAAKEGYRITAVAGYAEQWRLVATSGTAWGEQQVAAPSPFDQRRKLWLKSLWQAGYRITALGGDDVPDKEDGWLFVMTKGTRWGKQVCSDEGAWPEAWIQEHHKQGYRITSLSGFEDRWLVVMTEGTTLGEQIVSPPGAGFPALWIKEHW